MYEDIASRKGSGTPVDNLLRLDYGSVMPFVADVPSEYIEFLTKVGWGVIGDEEYMLYSGPLDSKAIYGVDVGPEQPLIFGDDFQGYSNCFLRNSREVFEIDPATRKIYRVSGSFDDFICGRLAGLD